MRNDKLLRHLVAVRNGVRGEYGDLGDGVAIDHGFMDTAHKITPAGQKWLNSQFSPSPSLVNAQEILENVMPPIVMAAMRDVVLNGMNHEDFERANDIPQRSTKLVVALGHEMTRMIDEKYRV